MCLQKKLSLAYKVYFLFLCFDSNDSYGHGRYGSDWMFFPDGDGVPRFINLIPYSPTVATSRNKRDVEFRLYTKRNENYTLLSDLTSYKTLTMNAIMQNTPIKVITHGWMSTADKGGVVDIVNAYLQAREEVAVIAVDWSSYSMNYFYVSVASETKEVGKRIAQFLDFLHYRFNVSGEQVHLIGHSLGAHVMGIAGFETKLKIGRITGLDPALPMFKSIQKDKSRLDYDDATFVDVIHTCGGVLGFWDAIGTADFYPNKGMAPQPGCKGFNMFQFEACSHGRSIVYFAESITNPMAFPAYKCNNWNQHIANDNCKLVGFMGESASLHMSGIFYLQTNSEEPYGKGLKRSK